MKLVRWTDIDDHDLLELVRSGDALVLEDEYGEQFELYFDTEIKRAYVAFQTHTPSHVRESIRRISTGFGYTPFEVVD